MTSAPAPALGSVVYAPRPHLVGSTVRNRKSISSDWTAADVASVALYIYKTTLHETDPLASALEVAIADGEPWGDVVSPIARRAAKRFVAVIRERVRPGQLGAAHVNIGPDGSVAFAFRSTRAYAEAIAEPEDGTFSVVRESSAGDRWASHLTPEQAAIEIVRLAS